MMGRNGARDFGRLSHSPLLSSSLAIAKWIAHRKISLVDC